MKFPCINVKELQEKIAHLKKAEITTELLPHQSRVVEKLKTQPGLLVAHQMGRGKTLSSISAIDALKKPATVITPASLKGNFSKEVQKHTDTPLDIHQDSLENLARKGTSKINPTLVVDEAHRARNKGKTLSALKNIASKAEKRVLLTGTPMVNRPSDISPLINIVSGETLLPEDRGDFEKKYVYDKQVSPGLWNKLKGIKPGIIPVLNKVDLPGAMPEEVKDQVVELLGIKKILSGKRRFEEKEILRLDRVSVPIG
jgi:SNF2 family DNA or RNA helicase